MTIPGKMWTKKIKISANYTLIYIYVHSTHRLKQTRDDKQSLKV